MTKFPEKTRCSHGGFGQNRLDKCDATKSKSGKHRNFHHSSAFILRTLPRSYELRHGQTVLLADDGHRYTRLAAPLHARVQRLLGVTVRRRQVREVWRKLAGVAAVAVIDDFGVIVPQQRNPVAGSSALFTVRKALGAAVGRFRSHVSRRRRCAPSRSAISVSLSAVEPSRLAACARRSILCTAARY
jgi:hypothetical protein